MSDDLWNKININTHLDPAAGLLYCLRYDSGVLKEKRYRIVEALVSKDVSVELNNNNNLKLDVSNTKTQSDANTISILLEELSILNESLYYSDMGLNKYKNMTDVKNSLIRTYNKSILSGNTMHAGEIINEVIPSILHRMYDETKSYKLLSSKDKNSLSELVLFEILKSPKHKPEFKHDFFYI